MPGTERQAPLVCTQTPGEFVPARRMARCGKLVSIENCGDCPFSSSMERAPKRGDFGEFFPDAYEQYLQANATPEQQDALRGPAGHVLAESLRGGHEFNRVSYRYGTDGD